MIAMSFFLDLLQNIKGVLYLWIFLILHEAGEGSIVGNYYYGEINIAFFEGKSHLFLQLFRAGVVVMVLFCCLAELNCPPPIPFGQPAT